MCLIDHSEILHTSWQLHCPDMCKISLWSIEYNLNQSTAKFGRISIMIKISLVGRCLVVTLTRWANNVKYCTRHRTDPPEWLILSPTPPPQLWTKQLPVDGSIWVRSIRVISDFHTSQNYMWDIPMGHVGCQSLLRLLSWYSTWEQGSRSTLAQVMACCLMAPSHYLNQCWLIITKVQWCSSEGNFAWDITAITH